MSSSSSPTSTIITSNPTDIISTTPSTTTQQLKPEPEPAPASASAPAPAPSNSSSQSQPSESKSKSESEFKWNSPGNLYKHHADTPPMKKPGMEFIWRLECEIAKQEIEIGAPHSAGIIRSIANIVGGVVEGPEVKGVVVPLGGADWATVVEGTHSMTLNARYTILTNDNHHIYIRAKGLYRPGPGTTYSQSIASNPRQPPPHTVTQDDVEFFSHLRIEAGMGKYNWLNGLVCVGVMTCVGTRVVIDAYYLTNFAGVKPDDVVAVAAVVKK